MLWLFVTHCGSLWFVVACCGSLWLVVVRCGSMWLVLARCGSFWLIVVRCGSLWLVVARCGSLHSIVWPVLTPCFYKKLLLILITDSNCRDSIVQEYNLDIKIKKNKYVGHNRSFRIYHAISLPFQTFKQNQYHIETYFIIKQTNF